VRAIRAAAAGEAIFGPEVAAKLVSDRSAAIVRARRAGLGD
jgi:hypothetical protein